MDVLACPCGSARLQFIAFITEATVLVPPTAA
jgi:hypothetical protein